MMQIDQLSARLRERLRGDLPGPRAQQLMQVKTAVPFKPHSSQDATPAAVLILLFPRPGGIHFFLTARTWEVEHHKGQISLPGGVSEAGERPRQTALRETQEELNIDPAQLIVLGQLSPLFVAVTGFMIHPFIAATPSEPRARPQPGEVQFVLAVGIDSLLNEDLQRREERVLRGVPVQVPYYMFGDHKIWGATAMILAEFKAVLKDSYHA